MCRPITLRPGSDPAAVLFRRPRRSTPAAVRRAMPNIDFAVGIGGAAGQGVATPGNILAKLFARRGLHINAYNAYQSIIRGGHTFLTIRTSEQTVRCMGHKLDILL